MKLLSSAIAAAVLVAFGTVFALTGITEVEPGEEAVLIQKIGAEKGMRYEVTLDTGFHWWNPIKYDIEVYDVKCKQEAIELMEAQTKDGQPIVLDVSFEICLDGAKVPVLHETVGRDYWNQVVYPMVRKAIRYGTSTQLSDEIYQGSGRKAVEAAINEMIEEKLSVRGIIVETINIRDIQFKNQKFIDTLEQKASATQQEIIQKRMANAAVEEARKVANQAEGQKQKRIKAAEADREERRLQGEGQRLQLEEKAKGNLAIYTAEAEGRKLLVNAYGSSEAVVSVEWAKQLGPNIKVYGVPTGAPGTSSYMFDSAMRDMLKSTGAMSPR